MRKSRVVAVAGATTLLALGVGRPVDARPTIPEEQLEAGPGRQVIHIRVQSGCGPSPTDRLDVLIPEGAIGVLPEAVPGWSAELTVIPTEPYELFGVEQTDRVSQITWTGGSIAPDAFLDFGIAAVFTEEGRLAFPVTQGCGLEEVAYTEIPPDGEEPADVETAALLIDVVPAPPDVDVVALDSSVEELRETIREIRRELDDIAIVRLRERVRELEDRIDALESVVPTPAASPRDGG
jgi:uncharacterized protein YcnI